MTVSVHHKLWTNLPLIYALEVEFFRINLLRLHPGYHYTPVGCHGMPETSLGGFAYTPSPLSFHGFEGKQKICMLNFSRRLISNTTAATPW